MLNQPKKLYKFQQPLRYFKNNNLYHRYIQMSQFEENLEQFEIKNKMGSKLTEMLEMYDLTNFDNGRILRYPLRLFQPYEPTVVA